MLIVWDTVRAYNLSLYGYPRKPLPTWQQWAQKGVTYKQALSPAPWTLPSHTCFFTGQWPFRLNSQWKFTLDAPYPTLAEYLSITGLSNRRVRRRTPTGAITRPVWIGALPISTTMR